MLASALLVLVLRRVRHLQCAEREQAWSASRSQPEWKQAALGAGRIGGRVGRRWCDWAQRRKAGRAEASRVNSRARARADWAVGLRLSAGQPPPRNELASTANAATTASASQTAESLPPYCFERPWRPGLLVWRGVDGQSSRVNAQYWLLHHHAPTAASSRARVANDMRPATAAPDSFAPSRRPVGPALRTACAANSQGSSRSAPVHFVASFPLERVSLPASSFFVDRRKGFHFLPHPYPLFLSPHSPRNLPPLLTSSAR